MIRTLTLALFLLACADEPVGSPGLGHGKVPDKDGDGYAVPQDCLDEGYAWRVQEPDCTEAQNLVFQASDGQQAKDFSVIRKGNEHHIFHIRRLGPWGTGTNETDFGHESSTDLATWTAHPTVQPLGAPGDWNDRNVWSPHVLEISGTYLMFYAGVTYGENREYNAQRIGLLTSQDLFQWTPANTECDDVSGEGCLLDCEAPWSGWDPDGHWTGDCRDPFVMPYQGGWLMFLTTILTNGKQVIARAQSPNLVDWTMLGPIGATEGGRAESPAVIQRNGAWVLFWTDFTGVALAEAIEPLGVFVRKGVVHQEYASELLPHADGSWLYAYVDGFQVRFQRMTYAFGWIPSFSNIASPLCRVPAVAIHPGRNDPPNAIDDNCDGYVDHVVVIPPPIDPPHPPPRIKLPPMEAEQF